MWKRRVRRMLACVLAACMLFLPGFTDTAVDVHGDTKKEIDQAKSKIDALKEQKEDAQNAVEDITDRKNQLETDLSSLNDQLSDMVSDMNDLEGQISDKENEIAEAQEELADAQDKKAKQYEAMKLRIQFMYENSGTSEWQMFLSSDSWGDFINRTEYITQIHAYDRRMLKEYEELSEEIAEKEQGLVAEREELVALQDEMQEKKDELGSLISSTRDSISQTNEELSEAQTDVDAIDASIQEMIDYEKELEIRKAKEDAARLAAIREQEKENRSGVTYVPADSDAYLLGAIIQCESDGEPYEGKLAVGSVVLNRVKSSYFPNTISGVIYQSGQFSPVASGRLAYRLQAGVNSTCLQAANEVLGGNITTGCLYFRVDNGIIQGTVIGHHVFY